MASIFTKIINGELPAYKIAENDLFIAILDIFPIVKGHTLVISKVEIDKIFDLNDELYQGLFLFSKKVAVAIEKAIPCTRVGMAVVGLEVPHAHINLVPLNDFNDFNFRKEKLKLSPEELSEITGKIKSYISD